MSPAARPARALPVVGALLLAFAACGSGGGAGVGAGSAPAAAPRVSTAAPPATAPAAVTPPARAAVSSATASCGLRDFQSELLRRVNAARAAGATCGREGRFAPAPPLRWNERLARAAQGHSRDMVARGFFEHTAPDGRDMAARVQAAGYDWRSVGENIAAGQTSVAAVVDGWLASDGHCANLLSPRFTEMGAACVTGGPDRRYRTTWTLDLARPR